jgi:hypothetical protein
MAITKENAVDMAWKTEGLEKILEKNGDPRSKSLGQAQIVAMWDPVLVGIPGISLNQPNQEELEYAYQLMDNLATEFKYDSGNRKYDSI